MTSHRIPTVEEVTAALNKRGCVIWGMQGSEAVFRRGRRFGTVPMGVDRIPLDVLRVTLGALDIDWEDFWEELEQSSGT